LHLILSPVAIPYTGASMTAQQRQRLAALVRWRDARLAHALRSRLRRLARLARQR